jgi:hypothetical protein
MLRPFLVFLVIIIIIRGERPHPESRGAVIADVVIIAEWARLRNLPAP